MAASTLSTSQQLNTTLKGQKQNKKALRNVLTSPYVFSGPELNKSSQEEIIKTLRRTFTSIDLKRSRAKQKRGKSKSANKDEMTEEKPSGEEPSRITNLRAQLVAGVNAVARGLERDQLRVVLVDQGTRPPLLTRHILTTAALHACPVLVIKQLARTLAPLLDISSLAAVGLKKLSEGDEADFDPLVEFLVERAVPLSIPWLSPPDPPTVPGAEHTQDVAKAEHAQDAAEPEHTQSETKTDINSATHRAATEAGGAAVQVRPPPQPPVDFNSIYVKTSDSVLTDGKVNTPDFGSAGFLAFGDSSDDEESIVRQKPKKTKRVGKTRGVKRKSGQGQVECKYETPRIGKIKGNNNRALTKKKKK